MRAAIHQPQYFPYPGFFHKLSLADVFVVMDDVQYERGFVNRNRILDPHGVLWLSVPIDRNDKFLPISEVRINNAMAWRSDHWKKILVSYSNSRFFGVYRDWLEDLYTRSWDRLVDLNLETIRKTMDWLGLRIPLVMESELGVRTTRTERIIDVCKAIGADTYVSGKGGRSYLEEGLFASNGVQLEYQSYLPLSYPQRFSSSFVQDLSILDMLANLGPDSMKLMTGPNEFCSRVA